MPIYLQEIYIERLRPEAEFLDVIGTKPLREFSSLLFTVTITNLFPPPPPEQKWFELVDNVNIVCGNLPTRQAGLHVGLVLYVCLLPGCDYINRYEHNPRKTVSCIPLVNWNIIGTGSIPGVNGLKIVLDYVLWNELTCQRPSLNCTNGLNCRRRIMDAN